ncbi:hypothetical protein BP00DRAFT_275669 [Aspergillus indologenus CBS 114.80]|uniref:Uncharacterized protein n=1 Tax=Aspergillus indologenus CBS 114.80 TaxID=1450541 RepID=A0A2V5HU72_9EURO|nr:hypothetical protein BP00DRAFT_275669 [Aspergillus indologenus CBS 114.80]
MSHSSYPFKTIVTQSLASTRSKVHAYAFPFRQDSFLSLLTHPSNHPDLDSKQYLENNPRSATLRHRFWSCALATSPTAPVVLLVALTPASEDARAECGWRGKHCWAGGRPSSKVAGHMQ